MKPLIEKTYRTNGEDALMGESLAGLFIVETFLKQPDAVDAYVAISPSLWWDFGSLGKQSKKILDDFPKGEREIYLAIANEGGAMREGVLAVGSALKKEKPKGVAWTFSDRLDLEHSTISSRRAGSVHLGVSEASRKLMKSGAAQFYAFDGVIEIALMRFIG